MKLTDYAEFLNPLAPIEYVEYDASGAIIGWGMMQRIVLDTLTKEGRLFLRDVQAMPDTHRVDPATKRLVEIAP